MPIQWNEREKAIVRDLLTQGWPALSRGDRSVVFAASAGPGRVAATAGRSPHAEFWENLVALGWAQESKAEGSLAQIGSRLFSFTEQGLAIFPAFAERFKLPTVIVRDEQPETRERVRRHVTPDLIRGPASSDGSKGSGTPGQARGDEEERSPGEDW